MKNCLIPKLLSRLLGGFVLVILVSCASSLTSDQKIRAGNKEEMGPTIPTWYSDYLQSYPECESAYLCVLGEGDTLSQAEQEARLEAAKFFATKISASSQLVSSSEQKNNQSLGDYSEWASKNIKEETNEMINGLETKQQGQAGGRIYLVMSLNRQKAANVLSEKITALDQENSQLLKANSRFSYPRILRNLSLSEPLVARYNLLTTKPLKLEITKASMIEAIAKLSPLKLLVLHKGAVLPEQLSHTINEMLAPLKIIPAKKGEAGIQQILVTDFKTEELYFKVEGFKRLNVILKLELQNIQGEALGRLSAVNEQTSRSKEKAMEAALPILKDLLLENFNQLGHVANNL